MIKISKLQALISNFKNNIFLIMKNLSKLLLDQNNVKLNYKKKKKLIKKYMPKIII